MPELQAWAAGFPTALLHVSVAFALLIAGCALHAFITPRREIQLIRQGNAAAAVSFGGVIIGLAIPLAVALAVSNSAIDVGIWGVGAVFVQLALFRLTDFLLSGLPQRIVQGDMAAAGLLVCAKLATAVLLGAALTG